MAKRKKKIEFENIEPIETFETSIDTDLESVETFEKSVESSVETLANEVLEPVEDVKNVEPSSKYNVGNIINIKGIPYIVRGFNEGVYTLMNFNKNVIEIPETEL